jgi:hypothetical protein
MSWFASPSSSIRCWTTHNPQNQHQQQYYILVDSMMVIISYRYLSLAILSLILFAQSAYENAVPSNSPDSIVEYGMDISFPMQHNTVSTNYLWLPHNVDPTIPTPHEYQGMPIQPLGDRQTMYVEFLKSCVDFFNAQPKHEYDVFGVKGGRCIYNEADRIQLSLTQPRSMQVSRNDRSAIMVNRFYSHPTEFIEMTIFDVDIIRTTQLLDSRKSGLQTKCSN